MTNLASEFLKTWALARESKTPLSREEAEAMASDWQADAEENGITAEALEEAAGGNLPAYLVGIFGEADQGVSSAAPE